MAQGWAISAAGQHQPASHANHLGMILQLQLNPHLEGIQTDISWSREDH